MSKAILEFDLEDFDDKKQHLRCIKSTDMACLLFAIQVNLRKKMTNELTPDEYVEGVDDTFNSINDLFDEYHINLDELID